MIPCALSSTIFRFRSRLLFRTGILLQPCSVGDMDLVIIHKGLLKVIDIVEVFLSVSPAFLHPADADEVVDHVAEIGRGGQAPASQDDSSHVAVLIEREDSNGFAQFLA